MHVSLGTSGLINDFNNSTCQNEVQQVLIIQHTVPAPTRRIDPLPLPTRQPN